MKKAIRPAIPSPDFCSVAEIGQASDGLFGTEQAADRLRLVRLENAWGRAVGARLHAVARPSGYEARALVVDVRDARWKRELDRLKPEILLRLERLLPSYPIADISFRVRKTAAGGAAIARGAALERAAAVPPEDRSADLVVEMSAPLKSVSDRDLRDRLSHVMGRYLSRSG